MHNVDGQRKGLFQLLKQLVGDSARLAEAELALSQQQLKSYLRQYVMAFALAALATLLALVSLMMLSQAAAIALTPLLGSAALGYLVVGVALTLATIGLFFVAKRSFTKKHKPVGLISKWLATRYKTP